MRERSSVHQSVEKADDLDAQGPAHSSVRLGRRVRGVWGSPRTHWGTCTPTGESRRALQPREGEGRGGQQENTGGASKMSVCMNHTHNQGSPSSNDCVSPTQRQGPVLMHVCPCPEPGVWFSHQLSAHKPSFYPKSNLKNPLTCSDFSCLLLHTGHTYCVCFLHGPERTCRGAQ